MQNIMYYSLLISNSEPVTMNMLGFSLTRPMLSALELSGRLQHGVHAFFVFYIWYKNVQCDFWHIPLKIALISSEVQAIMNVWNLGLPNNNNNNNITLIAK